MTGFKTGVGLHLVSTQLPKLFGFKGSHGDFWERMGQFLSHLRDTNPASLALGCGALLVLILGKRFLPNRPVSLVVLVAGILAVPLLGLEQRGVSLLGEVPQGLPLPGLPAIHPSDLNLLLPLAMACFLLGAVETIAIGRTFARKHGYRLDSNQEFLALSGANLAAGLGHGFPVSGGMSQSLVNEGGGARTPLSGLFALRCRARGRAVLRRPPARPAAAGARGDRADGRQRPAEDLGAAAAVAVQPRRDSRSPSPRSSASWAPGCCAAC